MFEMLISILIPISVAPIVSDDGPVTRYLVSATAHEPRR
jgi:hypothetical protein